MQAGLATDKWKCSLGDYETAAVSLAASMRSSGFLPTNPIPIDVDGELLNGSHRVACALALGIEQVPFIQENRKAWAPAWDVAWFIKNGMPNTNLMEILSQQRKMLSSAR
jgi:hypothetical protein